MLPRRSGKPGDREELSAAESLEVHTNKDSKRYGK